MFPFGAQKNQSLSFKYVRVLEGSSMLPFCAFHNLVRSYIDILSFSRDLGRSNDISFDWLVFGNDHSFIIPSNLACFLRSLDHEDFIYTGNKLYLNYRGSSLTFASGGAGAVLSHSCLKLMLITWTIHHSGYVYQAYIDSFGHPFNLTSQKSLQNCFDMKEYDRKIFEKDYDMDVPMNEINIDSRSPFNVICSLRIIWEWSHHRLFKSLKIVSIYILQIYIHSFIYLLFFKNHSSKYLR